ncbi:MAG: PilZ domain-containing protein [Zetaproteobacteria bacterium]|nr:PilZ domain-containing protein [Zetaproteobacteria bacterium]
MGGRENRRVIRVRLVNPLTVTMGSIGSDVRYDLQTHDISNNGFFLDFEKPGRFPFTPSSIMEVWMVLGTGEKIFFNGKMARVVYPNDEGAKVSGPGIAVRIIQIEPDQEKMLVDYISYELENEDNVESAS